MSVTIERGNRGSERCGWYGPGVRQLLPDPRPSVDVEDVYAADARAPGPDRPWVLLNMVAGVDGATAVGGRSGDLGGPGDRLVFGALRGVPDVILVAAGTVRAEDYGPPRPSTAQQARRAARGQQPFPRIAIVTSRLDLALDRPLFTDSPTKPIVITDANADAARVAAVREVAEVLVCGDRRVDLRAAITALRPYAGVVLCEGGPSLNGELVAADLVDEICLSVGPTLVGGESARIVHGPEITPVPLVLQRVLEHDGALFLRYTRAP